MRSTDVSFEVDERGVFSLLAALTQAALAARDPSDDGKPSLFERFDRWAARARQRDHERWLAESKDVFELERRIRQLERRPYF